MNRFSKKVEEIKEKYANRLVEIDKEIARLQDEQDNLFHKCRDEFAMDIPEISNRGETKTFWFSFSEDTKFWNINSQYGRQYPLLPPEEAVALMEFCSKKYVPFYDKDGLKEFDEWFEEEKLK